MRNRIIVASLALGLLSTSALAADLPSRRAPPVYVPPPVTAFSWTGAYVGVNAGYGFDNNHDLVFNGNQLATATSLNQGFRPRAPGLVSTGFTGGGTIGYNFELGRGVGLPVLGGLGGLGVGGGGIVIGIEADAAYTDFKSNNTYIGTNANPAISNIATRTEYVGTARGRVGYAFNNVLIYGTGGFAYGGVRDAVRFASAAGATQFTGGQDRIQTGYAYGGGFEYAIPTGSFLNFVGSSAVTVKVEYIHYDLGRDPFAVTARAGTGSYTASDRVAGNLVRAGLNYKFDFAGPAPVVARY